MFFNEIIHHFHYVLSHLPRTPLYSVTKGCIYTYTCAQRPCYTYANAVALTSTHAYTIYLYPFLFDSMREGSPSVWADFQGTLHLRADLQGALHLRTLITINVLYPLLLCDWVTKRCYSSVSSGDNTETSTLVSYKDISIWSFFSTLRVFKVHQRYKHNQW